MQESQTLWRLLCASVRLFLANTEIPLSKRGIGILFFFIIIVRHLSALRRRKIEKKLAVDLTGANFSIGGGKNSVNFPQQFGTAFLLSVVRISGQRLRWKLNLSHLIWSLANAIHIYVSYTFAVLILNICVYGVNILIFSHLWTIYMHWFIPLQTVLTPERRALNSRTQFMNVSGLIDSLFMQNT